MDDATFAMEIVESQQDLFGDLLDKIHRNAAVVPPLDQAEQVLAQNLENHANVGSVGALVFERVEKADNVFPAGMVRLGLNNLIEKLDLIDGGFGVVGGRTDDLERDMLAVGIVSR